MPRATGSQPLPRPSDLNEERGRPPCRTPVWVTMTSGRGEGGRDHMLEWTMAIGVADRATEQGRAGPTVVRATVHGTVPSSIGPRYIAPVRLQPRCNPRTIRGARAGRSGLRRVSTVTVVCVASASRSAGRLQPPPPGRSRRPRGGRALRPLLAPSRRRLRSTGTRRNVNAEFCLQGLFDSNHAAAASIRAAGNLTRG